MLNRLFNMFLKWGLLRQIRKHGATCTQTYTLTVGDMVYEVALAWHEKK